MKDFAELYGRLDASTSNNAKLAALQDYFASAAPEDAAWAVYFLSGGKPRQLVPVRQLRDITLAITGLPEWLFEESYQAVGDLAETISLLLPPSVQRSDEGLATWVEEHLLPLRGLPPAELAVRLPPLWARLDRLSLLVCLKLVTGAFRVGVSRLLVTRALANLAGLDPKRVAQRMVGYTDASRPPSAQGYARLIAAQSEAEHLERGGLPYPFFLAHPLQAEVASFADLLGSPANWLIEWKWDGIRAQLVRRDGHLWIWSRGEELVSERFPELHGLAHALPDGTVIDGEILVWKDGRVQPFALLQQRIARKRLTRKVLDDAPVRLVAYDLLEWRGEDWRQRPLAERRERLEQLLEELSDPVLELSPEVRGEDWPDLARQREGARALGVEGMMLKARDALYGVGRTKDQGTWWKWKLDPYSVDAVLIYAQRGHGRRANLYTDFTFAVWDGDDASAERALVPFAKAYSGLTDEEMRKVDAIVRRTTVEKFGPVRSVTPTLVFELGFEGIALSKRHKSGVAVRFPRMLRWRQDKPVAEADTLASLQALLADAAPEPEA
ncbi:ATP-dependent DNA ligase [Pseudomonas solani]|uniref:ATP-dependent DNA ligase n=1 Tax=Pseudomonas solani TaxID=2731552 RepID=UPI003F4AED01